MQAPVYGEKGSSDQIILGWTKPDSTTGDGTTTDGWEIITSNTANFLGLPQV